MAQKRAFTIEYDYDPLGNLRTVTLPNGNTIDYIIDGANRRVGKVVNGELQIGWLYQDALNPVAQLDGQNRVVARFVYADKPNVPALMIKVDPQTGEETSYRIVSDQLGSVRRVINTETGEVAQALDYSPFGQVTQDTNPGFQPFGFAGGLQDPDTGLVRFGARDYDPVTGRWTRKDPILFAGGDTNLYGYVLNDPVNLVDSEGLLVVAVRAEVGNRFLVFRNPNSDPKLFPEFEGMFEINNANCFFLCFFDDNEFDQLLEDMLPRRPEDDKFQCGVI